MENFTIDTETAKEVVAFGYDATDDRGRRKANPTRVLPEWKHATAGKRKALSASAQDIARNFELAAWAIRKHLDYNTDFRFQAKTEDRDFNRQLEAVVKALSSPQRCDVAGRHNLAKLLRITEACAIKDGDLLLVKVKNGPNRGKLQGVESYRIDRPRQDFGHGESQDDWFNGVRVSKTGAHLAYAICDVDNAGRTTVKRKVSAKNCIYHGCIERFDQVRGVSPLAAALNRFRDTYEGFEYAHAKLKVSQLFGLEFYRSADGDSSPFGTGAATATLDRDAAADGTNDSGYEIDLSSGGPFVLDMDPDDRVSILESKTPATETVNFLQLAIHLAIKALDIPYSFFDESFTNFYGSRGGLIQYLKSCDAKRACLIHVLNQWTRWRLGIAVIDGELQLPPGFDFESLEWEWIPAGVPWWDSVKEGRGAAMSISMGLSSPQRECRLTGTDFEKNILETSDALRFAEENGVDLKFNDKTAFTPEVSTEDAAEEGTNDRD